MNKSEFFKLPVSRKGIELLLNEFNSTNEMFFNEVSRALRTYLQLPSSVKKISSKFSYEETYNKYSELKKAGYRKELILPF